MSEHCPHCTEEVDESWVKCPNCELALHGGDMPRCAITLDAEVAKLRAAVVATTLHADSLRQRVREGIAERDAALARAEAAEVNWRADEEHIATLRHLLESERVNTEQAVARAEAAQKRIAECVADRDEARSAAKTLAHCYTTDTRPPKWLLDRVARYPKTTNG